MSETRATPSAAAPVMASGRIHAIDTLRGFAVLGILIVNIQSFAWVTVPYFDPTAATDGAIGGIDFWIWTTVHLLAETKFISIFSMLFGAGMAMMSERMARRGVPGSGPHYRRQLWLLLIGLAHAYLIWAGDVLVPYALCGFILYRFRKWTPTRLLWSSACTVAIGALLIGAVGWSMPYWTVEERAAVALEYAPPPEAVAAEIEAFRGGWAGQMPIRAGLALALQTAGFLAFLLWRAGGLMLAGMALYRLGVLSGERSDAFYRRMVAWGLGAGFPIIAAGIWYNVAVGFAWEKSAFQGLLFNYVGSVGVFLGYVGAMMLLARSGRLARAQARLAAVGRMALTNYIAQSVLCTLIFHGHGLGLFERVGSVGCIGIVLGIWALQLAWSPWWLARFRFGPLEWLWRTLSYGRRQPMRIA